MNIGIIGIGRIGKIHLSNCLSHLRQVNVTAVMNPSLGGQEFARTMGVTSVSSDAGEVLENPDIDAVLICSATDSHAEYVEAAARAGKAIFCEKPLDLSLDRVRRTLDIVKEYRVPLMLAFNQRFDPNFADVRQRIQSGMIGNIRSLHIISRDPGPPPISYIKKSGGMLMDMTIHDFDMARFQMGCEVTQVFAQGSNVVSPAIAKAGDIDFATVMLTFENGATALIENCREAAYGYDQRLEVFGSKGMIRTENPLKTTNSFSGDEGTQYARNLDFFMDRYAESYLLELKAFFDALQNNERMPATGDDGLKAMEIAAAAYNSIEENRPILL
ncbi:MAG TPA: inositol 2-dehydrogenase [Lunatimonas sp.]|nr:inositol 2-dehydrogenase [Lunatimonas sp.]